MSFFWTLYRIRRTMHKTSGYPCPSAWISIRYDLGGAPRIDRTKPAKKSPVEIANLACSPNTSNTCGHSGDYRTLSYQTVTVNLRRTSGPICSAVAEYGWGLQLRSTEIASAGPVQQVRLWSSRPWNVLQWRSGR